METIPKSKFTWPVDLIVSVKRTHCQLSMSFPFWDHYSHLSFSIYTFLESLSSPYLSLFGITVLPPIFTFTFFGTTIFLLSFSFWNPIFPASQSLSFPFWNPYLFLPFPIFCLEKTWTKKISTPKRLQQSLNKRIGTAPISLSFSLNEALKSL